MEKNKLITQAKKLHLSTKKEVLTQLVEEGNKIHEQIALLKSIDITNVEPMTRISKPISFLRDDEVKETFTKENVLKNAPQKEAGFIVIKKVVDRD